MSGTKISAGADPGSVVATDKVPMARSASTTAYAATMAELATYANGAYSPNYYVGTPSMDATGAPGTAAFVSRGDHVHPSDTSRVPIGGGTMTGLLTLSGAPTANLHAATKLYVDGSAPVGGPYVAIANLHDVGRNLLHNPLFNVAQRGAGPFTASGYTLDRWHTVITTDTVSISRVSLADADRAAIGDEQARVALQNVFTGNAATGAFHYVRQPLESAWRLGGKTVTASFWAKAASGTPGLGVAYSQYFGSGGSPSTTVVVNGTSVTLSTTWTRYTVTTAVPSTAGKTFGTNGDDATILQLWFSSGATNAANAGVGVQSGTIQLWGVQLEIGSVATPLEKPDPKYDLANCQRFYQTGFAGLAGYNLAGNAIQHIVQFPVTMRAVPTFTNTGVSQSNCSGSSVSAWGGPMSYQAATTVTATGACNFNLTYTASADL